jgi:dihydroorotase-like cyclic amidohydrolase
MSTFDLKLTNGRLATSEGVHPVDVGIRGGKIGAVAEWGTLPDAEQVIDVTGRVILPGGIDTHVHAGDPPLDFAMTSMAAALGGVTTIVDMPFQIPPTTDPETFDAKLALIKPKAYVDFALWATYTPGDVASMKRRRLHAAASRRGDSGGTSGDPSGGLADGRSRGEPGPDHLPRGDAAAAGEKRSQGLSRLPPDHQ